MQWMSQPWANTRQDENGQFSQLARPHLSAERHLWMLTLHAWCGRLLPASPGF